METETETETLKAKWPMADSPCGIGKIGIGAVSAGPLVSRHLCDQTGSRHLRHETPLTICGVLLSLSCFLSGQEKHVHICWWKEHVEQERALLCKKACLPPSSSFAECLQGSAMATMTC